MFYSYNDRPSVEEQTLFYLPGPMDAAGDRAVIEVTCFDIWEGTADAKVEQSDLTLREEALGTVHFMREEVCPGQTEEEARFRDNTRQAFVLPNSLSNGLGVAHSIGVILIMILGASAMGNRVWLGHLASGVDQGRQPLAVPGSEGVVAPADGRHWAHHRGSDRRR